MVEVKRTPEDGVRAFPFLCVTEPGTAPPQRQWKSTPFPLCIPKIPMEAALLMRCSVERGSLCRWFMASVPVWHTGICHQLYHEYLQPLILPQIPWKFLRRRRDVPPVEFEDLSYRRCDSSSPHIWKVKVWLSFAGLFPLILWMWSRCQHGGWNSTVPLLCNWVLLCNCTWQWERKITAHPWLWRLLGRYPNYSAWCPNISAHLFKQGFIHYCELRLSIYWVILCVNFCK